MKLLFKRIIVGLLSAGMLATTILSPLSVAASEVVATYTSGETTCTLYDDGKFVVSGIGAMEEYTPSTASTIPWRVDGNREKITSVIVEDGVTKIGAFAFQKCLNLTSVEIGSGVTEIQMSGFSGCDNADLVMNIKGEISKISTGAFKNVVGTITTDNLTTYTTLMNGIGIKAHLLYLGEKPTTGSISDTITWKYDENNQVLTISGSGAMPELSISSCEEMYLWRDQVKKLVFESGITTAVVEGGVGMSPWNDWLALESVKLADSIEKFERSTFDSCPVLKNLEILYKGTFDIGSGSIAGNKALEKLVIHASGVTFQTGSMFDSIPDTATAYVINEDVKASLEGRNWPGTIVVDAEMENVDKTELSGKIAEIESYLSTVDKGNCNEEQIKNLEVLETELADAKAVNESSASTQLDVDTKLSDLVTAYNTVTGYVKEAPVFTISCENIVHHKKGGFDPTADIVAGDGKVGYELFEDEGCTLPVSYPCDYDGFPVGSVYYIRGVMLESLNYASGYSSNVVRVEVVKNTISEEAKTGLNAAIEEANDFKATASQDDYDSTAWDKVYARRGDLEAAKSIAGYAEAGTCTEEEVLTATTNLTTSLESLKKAIADTTDLRKELSDLITTAEAVEADTYTDDSYAALTAAVNAAKALVNDATAKKTAVNNAKASLKSAIEGLVLKQDIVPAGEPFVKVYPGGKVVKVLEKTADEKMVGASKIKITFDCAADTSYNPYASIEMTAVVNGIESYQRFNGTGDYTAGTTGCEVELPLKQEIALKDSIELSAFTYSWDDASDYAYGITKVEFLDETGRILYTATDMIVASEKLASAVAAAEAFVENQYTPESFAKLNEAIAAAKALPDSASKEEMEAAYAAIDQAIKGLVASPQPTVKPTVKPTAGPTSKPALTPGTGKRVTAPKVAKVKKVKAKSTKKRTLKVTWKKQKGVKGYIVQVSSKKNFKKLVAKKTLKSNKAAITFKKGKIKSGKKYFVRVRAYQTYKNAKGKKMTANGKWVRIKKAVKIK